MVTWDKELGVLGEWTQEAGGGVPKLMGADGAPSIHLERGDPSELTVPQRVPQRLLWCLANWCPVFLPKFPSRGHQHHE